jgi:hypothetical protein
MPGPAPIDDELLRQYLAETLPPESMARVEKALRDSADLRQRLEDVRSARGEAGIHTLGAIWRRGRLSCPDRQQLGSYLLDALDPDLGDYVRFHLDVVGCPFCRANLADLQSKTDPPHATHSRRQRYFHSSRHLLSGDE